jgi:hypothetical protein
MVLPHSKLVIQHLTDYYKILNPSKVLWSYIQINGAQNSLLLNSVKGHFPVHCQTEHDDFKVYNVIH